MSRIPSMTNAQFSLIPSASVPRSVFNRSHGYKTCFNSGYLIPFFVDEALPGDTFHCKVQIFSRLSTPIFPIMDNAYMETHFFAVPLRLLWTNFQRFMGEQDNPGDSTDYIIPQLISPSGGWTIGSLSDYFGLPTGVGNLSVSALWHRAYNLIYNEWFRSQDLQDSVPKNIGDGPDNDSDYILLRRGKRHDYFTSALPFPQKGEAVDLPLGTTATVTGSANLSTLQFTGLSYTTPQTYQASSGNVVSTPVSNVIPYTQPNLGQVILPNSPIFAGTGNAPITQYPYGNLTQPLLSGGPTSVPITGTADLSSAASATINSLREAFQLQKLLERDARGGTRYTEILRAHFGVVSPDSRLQRPEYLGGSSSRVVVTPVQQTSSTNSTSPQGNLAAFATVSDYFHGFSKSFVEHCVIIGLVSVRADLTYQQGLHRMFSRKTRYDYYWPSLSHLGEQAILNKEIYAQGSSVTDSSGNVVDDQTFGYIPRWSEYRYFPSKITGIFRSSAPQSLDSWHLSQYFASLPVLNSQFIQETPPFERILAVTDEPQFYFDSAVRLVCARPMPVNSVPGFVDHF